MTRSEAAKTNGAQSHGPVTDAGKAISSRNALRHGLTAAQVVIPGEDPTEYDALVQSFIEEFSPVTVREYDLLSEAAAARWRLRRLTIMEQAAFTTEFERVRSDAANAKLTPEQLSVQAWNAVTLSPAMKQIHRHESRLRRVYEKARVELDAIVVERLRYERDMQGKQYAAKLIAEARAQAEEARAEHARLVAAESAKRAKSAKNANTDSDAAPVQNEPVWPLTGSAQSAAKRAA